MHRRASPLGTSASAALLLAALAAPVEAQTPLPSAPAAEKGTAPPADRADELFAQGNEAFDAERFEEAYGLYQRAWALKRTYDIAGNLGQVELKLGKFRDAAEHLEFTLRLFPPTGKSEPREAIRRTFNEARKQVATLNIKLGVQGAAVSIDGKPIGLSPFEVPVFVEPGKRVIEATLEAHLPTRITVEVSKNETRDVALALTPKAQPPPPPRSVPLLLTGFGLGLAAAGTGIGLMLASSEKGTAAGALLQTILLKSSGPCPCGSDQERAQLKGLRQDHDLFFNAAVGMFIGAGVLVVGTTAYALTPSFQRPQTTSVSVVPVASAGGGGALLIGTF